MARQIDYRSTFTHSGRRGLRHDGRPRLPARPARASSAGRARAPGARGRRRGRPLPAPARARRRGPAAGGAERAARRPRRSNAPRRWTRQDHGRYPGDVDVAIPGTPASAAGGMRLRDLPDGGSELEVRADVTVSVPLIGGKIEERGRGAGAQAPRRGDRIHPDAAGPKKVAETPASRHHHRVEPTAERRYVITLSCPDTTGIVARIAGFLADAGGWIVEAGLPLRPRHQLVLHPPGGAGGLAAVRRGRAAGAVRRGGRRARRRDDMDGHRHRRAEAHRAAGQQGAALPARPAGPRRRRASSRCSWTP